MTSIYEKKILAEVRLVHAEQMSFKEKIILRKKRDSNTGGICGICETFQNSGGCFWKHVIYYYVIKNYVMHKLAIFNAILLLYCIYC